jgi:thymidylate synthase (FAD)
MASYNEKSGRYTKLDQEFYIPERFRQQVGKKGNYSYVDMLDDDLNETCKGLMEDTYEQCWRTYENLLAKGVAKELARNVLPVGIYTQFTWKINLRSLFNFLSLRSDERAMYEIRAYSKIIERLVRHVVPVAFGAWESNGRTNP